jgi:hypothetical protein
MSNAVADYVRGKYLSARLLEDLEELASELVEALVSGKLKSGAINLQLAGALDKKDNPEFTLTVSNTSKRQRRYKLGEARQMSLFQPGES